MTAKKQNKSDAERQVLDLEAKIRDLNREVEELIELAELKQLGELKNSKITFGSKGLRVGFEEDKIEAAFIRFFRSDRIFAGFRNTPARVLITVISILILFGYGYYAFLNSSVAIWYLVFVLLALLLNAISVRFVFQMEGETPRHVLDEYHLKRRNKAKERAHDSLKSFIGVVITGGLVYGYKDYIFGEKKASIEGLPDAVFEFSLNSGQLIVVLIFVTGYVSLVKYFGYGLRGEPFRSNEEDDKLRTS